MLTNPVLINDAIDKALRTAGFAWNTSVEMREDGSVWVDADKPDKFRVQLLPVGAIDYRKWYQHVVQLMPLTPVE